MVPYTSHSLTATGINRKKKKKSYWNLIRPWKLYTNTFRYLKDRWIYKRFCKLLRQIKNSRAKLTHRILTTERCLKLWPNSINTNAAQQRFWHCRLGMPLNALSCESIYNMQLLLSKQHLGAICTFAKRRSALGQCWPTLLIPLEVGTLDRINM